MPANLPPQFHAISAKVKEAKTPEEKIPLLEELLAITPKHKGTEKLQGDIKAKIAKLKRQKPKKARRETLYFVRKEGAGQIVIIGPTNSGKSSLLSALTNAKAKVASYPFTTQIPQPAMMSYQNVLIQLVDTPPLTKESPPWLKGILKESDGLLAIFDLSKDKVAGDIECLKEILNDWGISDKKILFLGNKGDELCSSSTLRLPSFQKEAKVEMREKLSSTARAVDLEKSKKNLKKIESQYKIKTISCLKKIGIEKLKKEIFDLLEIIRVYTRSANKPSPDFESPFILKKNSRLIELANQIHKDFSFSFKKAKLFKKGSKKFRLVGKDYLLQDQDIVEIHI